MEKCHEQARQSTRMIILISIFAFFLFFCFFFCSRKQQRSTHFMHQTLIYLNFFGLLPNFVLFCTQYEKISLYAWYSLYGIVHVFDTVYYTIGNSLVMWNAFTTMAFYICVHFYRPKNIKYLCECIKNEIILKWMKPIEFWPFAFLI